MRARVPIVFVLGLFATSAATAFEMREYPVPDGAHPHDVAPAADGGVWYTAQRQGALGYLDPKTGRARGENPQIYAVYVDDNDIVWLSDFGANATLRFDPKTEKFTAFPHKSGQAAVRQILGRPGEVWLPESGTDRLTVIRE